MGLAGVENDDLIFFSWGHGRGEAVSNLKFMSSAPLRLKNFLYSNPGMKMRRSVRHIRGSSENVSFRKKLVVIEWEMCRSA